MSSRASSVQSRQRKALLSAAALTTAFTATAVTAVSATSASANAIRSAARVASKSKPKPQPPSPPVTSEVPPKGNVSLYEEGSTLLYPLFQLWAPAYHKQYSNITVNPAGGGSGKGISDAASGIVDIGASDAYLSSSQLSQYPGVKNIALAISAQMINYNIPGLSGSVHLKLSGSVISQIYQGKITTWNDPAITALNPGVTLPADKIVALHRSDSSGDTFIFSTYLTDSDPNGWGSSIGYGTSISFPSISNALAETGNGGMVTGCQATPGCIAYIGISYQSETQKAGLGMAELQNASGRFEVPVAPSIVAEAQALENKTPADEALSLVDDNASNGYPIINYEYAIIPPHEPSNQKAAAVKAFLYWATDPKQGSSPAFLNQVGFQPLPASVLVLTDKQIASIAG
ncbi:MAG TPA: phosphate ABC transporter substrate-binding protein PstS [Acidimicrobiales bacterium]|nr:phosphate ABC transporter substrate-binding protein PstS [Acidimicrobiales bacterium]